MRYDVVSMLSFLANGFDPEQCRAVLPFIQIIHIADSLVLSIEAYSTFVCRCYCWRVSKRSSTPASKSSFDSRGVEAESMNTFEFSAVYIGVVGVKWRLRIS